MTYRDSEVVDAFRQHLSQVSGTKFRLIGRPDMRDRTGAACDAILECSGHTFAVEHTSIDSFMDQRRDDDRFTKVLVRVEEELTGVFHEYVEFSVPVGCIPTGTDWQAISMAIAAWCRANVGAIPYNVWKPVSIPGAPFSARILKDRTLDFGFFVSRVPPEDLEDQRVAVIKTALETRGAKLLKYKEQGCRAILLLESQDIALGNPRSIGNALKAALAETCLAGTVDDVFLIITRFEPLKVICLKLGGVLSPKSWEAWRGYSLLR